MTRAVRGPLRTTSAWLGTLALAGACAWAGCSRTNSGDAARVDAAGPAPGTAAAQPVVAAVLPVADSALAAALDLARQQDKRVLVHLGGPGCGWCRQLEGFLAQADSVLAKDYVVLDLTPERQTGVEALVARFRPSGSGGIPWMVILDNGGRSLVTSDGPAGNIGYPVEAAEIDHFMAMLERTARRLSAAEVAGLRQRLEARAAEIRLARAAH